MLFQRRWWLTKQTGDLIQFNCGDMSHKDMCMWVVLRKLAWQKVSAGLKKQTNIKTSFLLVMTRERGNHMLSDAAAKEISGKFSRLFSLGRFRQEGLWTKRRTAASHATKTLNEAARQLKREERKVCQSLSEFACTFQKLRGYLRALYQTDTRGVWTMKGDFHWESRVMNWDQPQYMKGIICKSCVSPSSVLEQNDNLRETLNIHHLNSRIFGTISGRRLNIHTMR